MSGRAMSTNAVSSTKKRLAILTMAACIALSGTTAASGCGVRQGMENIDKAKDAKKQAEKRAHDLKKDLKQGREN